jgi:REP element-mobilizing transposase RayT
MRLPQWGGRRRGSGRKPKGPRALVSHKARPQFEKATPAHVTLRVAPHVWNLRSRRCFREIEASLAGSLGRLGLRVIEFSVLGNHLHLLVEADTSEALSRGMQGFTIRVAKKLNRLMRRSGRVFADHYHSRLLRSPTELVRALAYVLGNAARHYQGAARDPYSSARTDRGRTVAHPRSWLLRAHTPQLE